MGELSSPHIPSSFREVECPIVAKPPVSISSIFDTRDLLGTGGIPARGVKAVDELSTEFQAQYPVEVWTKTADSDDPRNQGDRTVRMRPFENRVRHQRAILNPLLPTLHQTAQRFGYKDGTLGRVSAVSCALFCVAPLAVRSYTSQIDPHYVPQGLVEASEFGLGISYMTTVLWKLGMDKDQEIDPEEISNFIVRSGVLVGPDNVCPIPQGYLTSLIEHMSLANECLPGTRHSMARPLIDSTDMEGLIRLGEAYRDYRLLTAIPWSRKPEGLTWEEWRNDITMDAGTQYLLADLERRALDLLGYPPYPIRVAYTPEEIGTMRKPKTVWRDDLGELYRECF